MTLIRRRAKDFAALLDGADLASATPALRELFRLADALVAVSSRWPRAPHGSTRDDLISAAGHARSRR